METVSVIIPVYNSHSYLDRCVDSVLNQKYNNIEVILINDGSTDNSGALCEKYALNDIRVKVFHKVNGGVSSARNLGIDMASGKYITFVDSDDYLESDYISDMVTPDDCDFVASHIKVEGWRQWKDIPLNNMRWDKMNIDDFLLGNLHRLNFMVCKLFKRAIIDEFNIRFDNTISYGEDTLFVYQYLKYISSARTISRASYHYNCYNISSLSKKSRQWSDVDYTINKVCTAIEELNDVFHCCCKYAQNVIVNNYLSAYIQSISKQLSVWEIQHSLKKIRKNKYALMQIEDKESWNKSFKRSFFDFCMINELYVVGAIMLYLSRYFS